MTDKQALRVLAKNVKRLREERGLSMNALAIKIGTYATNIKRIEDAEDVPGIGLLLRLCDGLGSTPNDLLRAVDTNLLPAS